MRATAGSAWRFRKMRRFAIDGVCSTTTQQREVGTRRPDMRKVFASDAFGASEPRPFGCRTEGSRHAQRAAYTIAGRGGALELFKIRVREFRAIVDARATAALSGTSTMMERRRCGGARLESGDRLKLSDIESSARWVYHARFGHAGDPVGFRPGGLVGATSPSGRALRAIDWPIVQILNGADQ